MSNLVQSIIGEKPPQIILRDSAEPKVHGFYSYVRINSNCFQEAKDEHEIENFLRCVTGVTNQMVTNAIQALVTAEIFSVDTLIADYLQYTNQQSCKEWFRTSYGLSPGMSNLVWNYIQDLHKKFDSQYEAAV